MTYQFLNQDQSIVGRIDDDGLMRITGTAAAWPEYLAWLDAGNTPEPAPEPPAPVALTTEQKLNAAGLTVAELRELFGLPAPVQEETVLVRARNEDGTYVADDPSTPENEAYTEVPLSDA